ncbi:hypothetical protein O0L34_g8768 [Tuta absoluta]|nr:hypothetical protein O0L34_g8768 [Tuta absoluta]
MGSYAKFVSDYCKAWDKSGKEQFLKTVTQFIKDDEKSPLFTKSGKLSGVSQSIYDLLLSGLRGVLKRDAVLNVLKDITALHADIPSILLDVVCVLDAETCTDIQSEERSNFCHIVRELESFLCDKLLKERLEIDTLQDVGTLKNKNFYTKFIKIKTKLYYKQRKFNLFREESEGYAKLIVELNQEISEEVDWKTILEIIQSLIGCFNLDPNRVLDIILESFEARPYLDQLFIPLIKNYMGDPQVISEVLGFKLGNMEVLESYKEPPPLMMIIALLLLHQVIALDDIYPWLRPDDSIMAKEADKEIRAAQDYIRKLSIVSTKGPQANAPAEFIEEKADPQEYWSNQKLVLSEALLLVTAWREFAALSSRLPTAAMPQRPARALCAMLHALIEPLYRRHCRVAPKIIGKPVPPLKSSLAPRACETFEDIKETVIPALILLGPSLHYDPILMYKIIRILRTSRSQPGDPLQYCALTVLDAAILPALTLMEGNCCCAEEVYSLLKLYPYQCRYVLHSPILPALTLMEGNCCCAEEVYSLLKLYPYQCRYVLHSPILPALTLMEGNCCCAEEVYSLLKLYPYQCRYCLYSRWKNESGERMPALMRVRGTSLQRIKHIMKRLSKENVKPQGRLIGKLSHAAPAFLFDYMLLQIQTYDNLIGPVVESLKYLTSLSLDVLGYCLLEALCAGRSLTGGAAHPAWLQALAAFAGAAFKKHNIELTALLQFVANRLKAQQSQDLLILKEIVQKMAGIEAAEEMTPEQLEAMAGGELLKGEAGYFSQVRNTRRSSARLKEAIVGNNLDIGLCILAAQQRHSCVWTGQYQHTTSHCTTVVHCWTSASASSQRSSGTAACGQLRVDRSVPAHNLTLHHSSPLLDIGLCILAAQQRHSCVWTGQYQHTTSHCTTVVHCWTSASASSQRSSGTAACGQSTAGHRPLHPRSAAAAQLRVDRSVPAHNLTLHHSSPLLDIGLCILAAQQRHSCVWTEIDEEASSGPGGSQLKVVGRLADQCQDALVQLGTFLASSHTPVEYSARLPPLQELLRDYHVDADVAFFLHRPVIAQQIAATTEALHKASDTKPDTSEKATERYIAASKEVLEPILVAIHPLLTSRVWEDISPEFYATFWSLSMYDLKVPEESYDREIDRLKVAAAAAARDTSLGTKGKKEQERFNSLIDKLQEERRRQQAHVASVQARLQASCAGWFPARAAKSAKNETVTRLMQLCLFPRCVFTPLDALYCAQFVHAVHKLRTPNFSTLLCYDRVSPLCL